MWQRRQQRHSGDGGGDAVTDVILDAAFELRRRTTTVYFL